MVANAGTKPDVAVTVRLPDIVKLPEPPNTLPLLKVCEPPKRVTFPETENVPELLREPLINVMPPIVAIVTVPPASFVKLVGIVIFPVVVLLI